MKSRTVIIDTEANGLRPDKVHCIVCKDEETGEFFEWKQEECYNEFPKWYKENVKTLIGHNIIGFDIPFVLSNLLNIDVDNSSIYDTLVLSRLFNTNRQFSEIAKIRNAGGTPPQALSKKPHSLEAWGIRTGLHQKIKLIACIWNSTKCNPSSHLLNIRVKATAPTYQNLEMDTY